MQPALADVFVIASACAACAGCESEFPTAYLTCRQDPVPHWQGCVAPDREAGTARGPAAPHLLQAGGRGAQGGPWGWHLG
jgi:hypothetical protein